MKEENNGKDPKNIIICGKNTKIGLIKRKRNTSNKQYIITQTQNLSTCVSKSCEKEENNAKYLKNTSQYGEE